MKKCKKVLNEKNRKYQKTSNPVFIGVVYFFFIMDLNSNHMTRHQHQTLTPPLWQVQNFSTPNDTGVDPSGEKNAQITTLVSTPK